MTTLRGPHGPPSRRGLGAIGTLLLTLALGMAWMAAEAAISLLTVPGVSRTELVERLLALLPWQLVLFGLWGLAFATLARRRRIPVETVAWLGIGAGAFSFLGVRLAENLVRTSTPLAALGGLAVLGAAIAALAGVLALVPRVLPPALRRAWTVAAGAGSVLLFVLFMQRVGYEIGRARGRLGEWLRQLGTLELLAIGAFAGGLLLALSGARARARLAGAVLLVAPLVVVFARSRPSPPPAAHRAAGPDVIVLLLDTTRADQLGAQRDGESVTPALDALSRDSVRFSRAFSPSNWTRGAMPGILTSIPYEAVGNQIPESVHTLAEHLHDAGWTTLGISANPLVTKDFGFAQGFDVFVDPHSMGDFLVVYLLQAIGAAAPRWTYQAGAVTDPLYFRDAAELRRRALALLDRSPGPSFLYVQFMDPHGPYLPPREYLPPAFRYEDFYSYYPFMGLRGRGILGTDAFRPRLENLRQRYASEVRYLDAELGRFFEALRARGRYEESLIWVLADHGEAFGEHDHAGHTGAELGNTLIHVPLLLKPPRSWGFEPRDESTPLSTYSLLPTTLGLLGLPVPGGLFGSDLSPLVRRQAAPEPSALVSRERKIQATIRWPWKLVLQDGHAMRLFQLEEDPDEARDVAAAHPDVTTALEEDLRAWQARVDAATTTAKTTEIDDATREQLRKLGYVE